MQLFACFLDRELKNLQMLHLRPRLFLFVLISLSHRSVKTIDMTVKSISDIRTWLPAMTSFKTLVFDFLLLFKEYCGVMIGF